MQNPPAGLIDRVIAFPDNYTVVRGVVFPHYIAKHICLHGYELAFRHNLSQIGNYA